MGDKVFPLDDVSQEFAEFKVIDRQYKQAKKWLERYKNLLKEVSQGANLFTLKGKQVATLVPGQLNKTLLAKEQPDIIAAYTRQVVKFEFDEAAFAKEHPLMHEQYRAQRLVLTVEKSVDPE